MCKSTLKIKKELDHFTLDVNVQIPSRGLTVLFGASGCGKTTILHSIAGLVHSSGQINISGKLWQDSEEKTFVKAYERSLGYVFQDAMLFETMNVEGNLKYALKNKEGANLEQMNDLIDRFSIRHLMKTQAEKLSGGEKQKVAIVRALMGTPDILLMDEPTASLDEKYKNIIHDYFLKLKGQLDIPILYVTHNVDEIMKLADSIGFIKDGKLHEILPIKQALGSLEKTPLNDEGQSTILSGLASDFDEESYTSRVQVQELEFLIPKKFKKNEPVLLRIHSGDVSLSISKNQESSILNVFEMKVESFTLFESYVHVQMISLEGSLRLQSKITKKSFKALDIKINKNLFTQIGRCQDLFGSDSALFSSQ